MDDFREIYKYFELSDFFSITTGKWEFENTDYKKELSRPTHRTATDKDFEDLYLREIEKRKILPDSVESFRNVLKDEIQELILFEKKKEKERKNYNIIALAENFVKWLEDSENFTYKIDLPDDVVTAVAILRRLGVIEFIRKNNPKTDNFNIAKILRKIINKESRVETIAQYLTLDYEKTANPFRDSQRISKIDHKLKELKISFFLDDNIQDQPK